MARWVDEQTPQICTTCPDIHVVQSGDPKDNVSSVQAVPWMGMADWRFHFGCENYKVLVFSFHNCIFNSAINLNSYIKIVPPVTFLDTEEKRSFTYNILFVVIVCVE